MIDKKSIYRTIEGTPLNLPARVLYHSLRHSRNGLSTARGVLGERSSFVRRVTQIHSHSESLSSVAVPDSAQSTLCDGWVEIPKAVRLSPGFWQPYLYHSPDDQLFRCYYEYRGHKRNWHIGLTTSDSIIGPYIDHHFPILSPSGEPGTPDEKCVADPTVLHFPEKDPEWYMWFDMMDRDGVWRLGIATSNNGKDWEKHTEEDGTTAVVLDVGEEGEWDDEMVHAPESFVYNDKVRLIYNAKGSGHEEYSGGLAVATDPEGMGYEFEKYGMTTAGETVTGGSNVRIKPPVEIDGDLYALHSRDTWGLADFCRSTDGCESWEHICSFDHHWMNSIEKIDGRLVGIGANGSVYVRVV